MKHLIRAAAGALLIPAFAIVAAPAQAQETFRIGFVNPDRVLREAQPAKAAQAKLEAEFLKREKDLTAQGDALKTASERFEREAPTISESQRATRQPRRESNASFRKTFRSGIASAGFYPSGSR